MMSFKHPLLNIEIASPIDSPSAAEPPKYNSELSRILERPFCQNKRNNDLSRVPKSPRTQLPLLLGPDSYHSPLDRKINQGLLGGLGVDLHSQDTSTASLSDGVYCEDSISCRNLNQILENEALGANNEGDTLDQLLIQVECALNSDQLGNDSDEQILLSAVRDALNDESVRETSESVRPSLPKVAPNSRPSPNSPLRNTHLNSHAYNLMLVPRIEFDSFVLRDDEESFIEQRVQELMKRYSK